MNSKTTISLILATDQQGVIGRENQMPWHLPSDLRFFKRVTFGKALIMGRKTYESIGRPLPGRYSIVLTQRPDYLPAGCEVARSLPSAIELAIAHGGQEIMIGGGGEIYRQALPMAERLYLTEVDAAVDGDVQFTDWRRIRWQSLWCQSQPVDSKHRYSYRRRLWVRSR